ncbi:alpha/beta fold hydrolase [Streptomyces sp. NPDC002550]
MRVPAPVAVAHPRINQVNARGTPADAQSFHNFFLLPVLTELDLQDVTLVGESMGAVLALTTAADLPERVRRVVAVNAYDFRGGIARSGDRRGRAEDRPQQDPSGRPRRQERAAGGLRRRAPPSGPPPRIPSRRPAVYQNLPSLIAARSRYPEVKAPVRLVYGEKDWARPSDREANKELLSAADFTQVPRAGYFIALERPDVLADLLNAVA